jgi:son of sevenless-like protein
LTDLTFIQDGHSDNLTGNIVNFRKRQKAFEVIQEIKRWQSISYNLQPIPSIQAFLDTSFKHYSESPELGDHFWNLSLDREPKEREDEFTYLMLQDTAYVCIVTFSRQNPPLTVM